MKILSLITLSLVLSSSHANALELKNQTVSLKSTSQNEVSVGECGIELVERVLAPVNLKFEQGKVLSEEHHEAVWRTGSGRGETRDNRPLTLVEFSGKLSSQFESHSDVTGDVAVLAEAKNDLLTGRVLSVTCSLAPFTSAYNFDGAGTDAAFHLEMLKHKFPIFNTVTSSDRVTESFLAGPLLTAYKFSKVFGPGELELNPEIVELKAVGATAVTAADCGIKLAKVMLKSLGLKVSKSKNLGVKIYPKQSLYDDGESRYRGNNGSYDIQDVQELNFSATLASIFDSKDVKGNIGFVILDSDIDPLSGKYSSISCTLAPFSPQNTGNGLYAMDKYAAFSVSSLSKLPHTEARDLFTTPKILIPNLAQVYESRKAPDHRLFKYVTRHFLLK